MSTTIQKIFVDAEKLLNRYIKVFNELEALQGSYTILPLPEDITELDDMVEFAILDNIRRRQLSDLQLVEYGIRLERLYDNRQGRSIKGGQNVHVCNGKTRDLVAGKIHQTTGVKMSGKKYDRLKTIATKAVPQELYHI